MDKLLKTAEPLKAIKTSEGFIEITALLELDNIVGGLVNAEDYFCELEDEILSG